ncbi:MAG: cysteine-rich CWC family protein [Burkholderiaceae bacterium]|nr:cysteine-rich CWC family protein [Burkholderiaceae bacterium]
MPAALPHVDALRCPLCGQANGCAMETARITGGEPATCWCMTATIDPLSLDRLPDSSRGLACICARCAKVSQPT